MHHASGVKEVLADVRDTSQRARLTIATVPPYPTTYPTPYPLRRVLGRYFPIRLRKTYGKIPPCL